MSKVLRKEKKYLVTIIDFTKHNAFLDDLLIQDSHNGVNGYMVRSLYFDSLYDRDFFEKEDGIEIRRKIRLRIYDPDSDFALLELKQKQGENQLKRSMKIVRDDAVEMTKGNYTSLLKYDHPLAAECYGIMTLHVYRPKAVVQYDRKAFIAKENKIRLTFDRNIAATENCFNIFDKNLCMYPVFDQFNVIFEVKYNGFLLDYIKDMIKSINKSEMSVGKYYLARSVGYNRFF